MDKQTSRKKRFYKAAIISGVVVIALMAFSLWFLWQAINADPASAPSTPLLVVVLLIPVIVAFGLFVMLTLRVGELSHSDKKPPKQD